jgi:hypothetical protein
MKYLLFLIAGAIFFLTSCAESEQVTVERQPTEQREVQPKTYVIAAGEHYCNESEFQKMTVSKIKFRAMFDRSAVYETKSKENQADINKLYGVSDCGTTHQINSARFGWVWNNNRLEIWAYTYADGQRHFSFVDTVSLDKFHEYEIAFTDSNYIFKLNDSIVELPRSCSNAADGYKLYPYFGGDETAPHEVTIAIEDLE